MPENERDTKQLFGPDRSLSIPNGAVGVSLWAKINSADSTGVTIDNVEKGDVFKIEFIGGSASFSDRSGWDHIKSIVGIVGTIPSAILGTLGAKVAEKLKEASKNANLNSYAGKGLQRNGYGRKGRDKRFALKEGGIIVCMPSAQGTIHAHKGSYLHKSAETEGRLREHIQAGIRDKCFFPVRGKRMEMQASESGVICILAFDSEFEDNQGAYEVKFTVTRPSRMDSGDKDMVEEDLLSCFSEVGL